MGEKAEKETDNGLTLWPAPIFSSLTEWLKCPTGIVAQIMGHKPSAIAEKHYRRRPLDLLRMWHDKIEAWMLEQAELLTIATTPSA